MRYLMKYFVPPLVVPESVSFFGIEIYHLTRLNSFCASMYFYIEECGSFIGIFNKLNHQNI